jgi:probable rRNA maturation factor
MTNPSSDEGAADEQIVVEVDDLYAGAVDSRDLAAAIAATLAAEQHDDDAVTLVITSDEAVAELNLHYRGIEGPTDVLSFPAQEPTPGFVSAPEMSGYLGDIVVALPYTQRQAAELGRNLADELRLLAVHGTLHLLGYDHGTPAEEAVMWAQQDAILARLAAQPD